MAKQVTSSQPQAPIAAQSPAPAAAKPSHVPQSYVPQGQNLTQQNNVQAAPTNVNSLRQYVPVRTPEMDILPEPEPKKKGLLSSIGKSRKKAEAPQAAKPPKAKKQKVKSAKTKVVKEKTTVSYTHLTLPTIYSV